MRKHRRSSVLARSILSTRATLAEPLEPRVFLSITPTATSLNLAQITELAKTHFAHPMFQQMTPPSGSISPLSLTPVGLVPSQIRGAYSLGQVGSATVTFGATQGDGTGQTIAIIDALDDPNALADLQHFDAQFGLPNPPSFQKFNESGQTSPLPSPAPLGNDAIETTLDIEWAHVIAPNANIDLIECNSLNFFDLLENGVVNAAQLPGVSVISMSFGGSEFQGESGIDAFMTSTTQNVTFVASTGDSGSPGSYPAYAQNVLAVGGTSLNVSGNTYVSESGWKGSGGGISQQEYQPSFQTPFFSTTQRTTPDVSMDADPQTGVAIYDSYDFPTSPWQQFGGTSLAAPMWAGVTAIVNQGRVFHGLSPLDGPGQTLPLLYGASSSDFNDPTTGSNGAFTAGPGYDLVTGRGSPIGNLLIPALATATAPARLSDLQPLINFNPNPSPGAEWSAPLLLSTTSGIQTDPTMITPGQNVFLDGAWFNNGSTSESASFFTDFQYAGFDLGAPESPGLAPGDGEVVSDFSLGSISAGVTVLSYSIDSTNVVPESTETNNTYTRTYIVDSTPNNHYSLQLDPTGITVQVLENNIPIYTAPKTTVNGLLFYLSGANDTLTVDATNGNPIPYGQVVSAGSASSNTLAVNAPTGNNTLTLNASQTTAAFSQLTLNGQFLNYTGLASITINTGSGNDSLTQLAQPPAAITFNHGSGSDSVLINVGSFAFPAANSGNTQQTLALLSIASGASVTVSPSTAPNHTILTLSTLTNSGLLNLTNNDMIVHAGNLTTITTQLKTAFNAPSGYWNGSTGITSTSAAADSRFLTTLGVRPGGSTLDSVPTLSTDVLVKYTYYGDATLDGLVNGADYQQIDTGFGTTATDWSHGDFNYDALINGSDFTLIDNTFNQLLARNLITTPLALPAPQLATNAAPTAAALFNPTPITTPTDLLDPWHHHHQTNIWSQSTTPIAPLL